MIVEVEYCDITFEVKGTYYKQEFQPWHHYSPSDSIDDVTISIQGIDVYEILSNKQIEDIIQIALEKLS